MIRAALVLLVGVLGLGLVLAGVAGQVGAVGGWSGGALLLCSAGLWDRVPCADRVAGACGIERGAAVAWVDGAPFDGWDLARVGDSIRAALGAADGEDAMLALLRAGVCGPEDAEQ